MGPCLTTDTETTGLPGNGRTVHIVQIAWILDDADGTTRQSGNFLIRPDGWTIPPEVVAIHGITTEIATQFGVDERFALAAFVNAAALAQRLVAHNMAFDWTVIGARLDALGIERPTLDRFCTQRGCAGLVPNGSPRGPKLVDAYRHFTGLALDNAHCAAADCAACRAVYYGLRAQGRT